MSDDIKHLLRAQLDRDLSLQPRPPVGEVIRHGRRRRVINWAASAMAAVLVLGTAGFITRALSDDVSSFNPARGGRTHEKNTQVLGNGCPRSEGNLRSIRWTSPTVRVADGENDGVAWILCARTAEGTDERNDGAEALCLDWLYGEGDSSGMGCIFSSDRGQRVPLDKHYFDATSGPEWGYFFGAVPSAAQAVELAITSGEVLLGTVYPAPEKLGVPFRFFTLFAEPFAEGRLNVRENDGDIIRQRKIKHELSQLVVTKDGAGEGTVTGYRTTGLFVYEACQANGVSSCRKPRPVWIECGTDCSEALDDAGITLIAEPAEGSRFIGWSGACTGTSPRCELTVDENLEATATFEMFP